MRTYRPRSFFRRPLGPRIRSTSRPLRLDDRLRAPVAFLSTRAGSARNATVRPREASNRAEERTRSEGGPPMDYLALAIFLSVGAASMFSMISIVAWSDARRMER